MSVTLDVDQLALAAVCEQFGVAELSIFGSVARGTASPTSDIDVLYVLRPGAHLGWDVNDLADELAQILGRPVDLVSKQALHSRLAAAVLSEATVVYAA